MNEITNEGLPWGTDDEVLWNAFLKTNTGARLLPKLAERVPALLDGGDTVNKILIRSGEVRGFQLAISAMLELTHSPPMPVKSETTNYPALDDDNKWEDGQITQR